MPVTVRVPRSLSPSVKPATWPSANRFPPSIGAIATVSLRARLGSTQEGYST